MSKNTQSYQENYLKLAKIANQLSGQDNIDIDQLVPLIDEAMLAYQFCKERIDSVEALLQSRLQQTNTAQNIEE
ncbi:MAG: exodeoxyribonuclease VII small subunit [Proteobacteria bacterium]|nr:exodeoxyribonuclease VII small subunit [Pseudomonadota bacterium]